MPGEEGGKPFFRRGSPFQPLLSSLTLDAYSGSETDPSEAFSGRRPRREDTGPSGAFPEAVHHPS